jgi:hypothetical protein
LRISGILCGEKNKVTQSFEPMNLRGRMRYVDFRDAIFKELKKNPKGMTWKELKNQLKLPYETPCQTWIGQLEEDIGLYRVKEGGRALIWRVK